MDTTTSVLLTGVLVTVGQWSRGKGLTGRIVIGVLVLAIFLSLLNNADEKVAKGMAALVLLSAAFTYLPYIVKKVNL